MLKSQECLQLTFTQYIRNTERAAGRDETACTKLQMFNILFLPSFDVLENSHSNTIKEEI